jgi:ABC-type branched-subunit amino acid transport system substrate-binding protein
MLRFFVVILLLSSCTNFNKSFFNKKLSTTNTSQQITQQSNQRLTNTITTLQQTNNHLESYNISSEDSNKTILKTKIAVFLPFSGKNKDIAQGIANATILSLFENDKYHKLELVFIDSKETVQEQKLAFQEIANRGIKTVIGPIYSNSINIIDTIAKEYGITVISLSNNIDMLGKIFDNGGGIFVAGILPETQIEKVVNYAISQNKNNFAILAPNNQYGKITTEYLKKFVKTKGGNFISSEFYNKEQDLDYASNKLINSFILPPQYHAKQPISESDKQHPQVIMIPESGNILTKAVIALKKQNTHELDLQLIGTSQWDEISTLEDSNLFGSWFVAPAPQSFTDFKKRYQQYFNKIPSRISSIAYDAVLAISQLQKEPTAKNLIDKKDGFNGIDGDFRFLPNGAVQRNLAVLEVGIANFEIADKPNNRFLRY